MVLGEGRGLDDQQLAIVLEGNIFEQVHAVAEGVLHRKVARILLYFELVELIKQDGFGKGELALEFAGLVLADCEGELDDARTFLGLAEEELEHAGDDTEPRWFEVLHVDGLGQVHHHNHSPHGVYQRTALPYFFRLLRSLC